MATAVFAATRAIAAGGAPRRVLIVDDSVVARVMLTQIVDAAPDFRVTAALDRAERALDWLRANTCDIVLLDIEMPGRSGLAALPDLISACGAARVVIVSSTAAEGAAATLQALALGAADAVEKPLSGAIGRHFGDALVDRLRSLTGEAPVAPDRAVVIAIRDAPIVPVDCVVIGASTGGIHAIARLLGALPRDFDAPILLTQHLPPAFIPFFADQLGQQVRRPCRVAQNRDLIAPGHIFIAPGHGHLTVRRQADAVVAIIDAHPARSRCMPSVDPMFASAAAVYGPRAVGVMLSGMGSDGAHGAAAIADSGGALLVQDAESATIWGMPGTVARKGLASLIASPERIASHLVWRRNAA